MTVAEQLLRDFVADLEDCRDREYGFCLACNAGHDEPCEDECSYQAALRYCQEEDEDGKV